MRICSPLLITSLMFLLVAAASSAQEKTLLIRPDRLALDAPIVSVRPAQPVPDVDTPIAAATRFSNEVSRRLQPVQQRFREDARLRSAGAALGVGAIALGALRGGNSLTFVGTQALRLGLDRQLAQIRNRSGFRIDPSIGHRVFAVTISRTFVN